MISKIAKGWIDAGKILAVNPELKVLCPKCGQYYLSVNDMIVDTIPDLYER